MRNFQKNTLYEKLFPKKNMLNMKIKHFYRIVYYGDAKRLSVMEFLYKIGHYIKLSKNMWEK